MKQELILLRMLERGTEEIVNLTSSSIYITNTLTAWFERFEISFQWIWNGSLDMTRGMQMEMQRETRWSQWSPLGDGEIVQGLRSPGR